MSPAHKLGAFVTAVLLLASTGAAVGDPTPDAAPAPALPAAPGFAHIGKPGGTLCTPTGKCYGLPAGYWQDEPTYDKGDAALKTAQDKNTEKTAENDSLRSSVSGWQPGWKTLLGAVVVGIGAGWYLHDKL